MCWIFPLRYVNIVVYLTAPAKAVAPRIDKYELTQFLTTIGPGRFASWDVQSREQLLLAGSNALKSLETKPNGPVAQQDFDELLAPLGRLLADHDLFALPAGYKPYLKDDRDTILFKRFLEYCGSSSEKHALVLIPDAEDHVSDRTVVDPLPAVELLAQYAENWPGILFWSRSGAAAFASLQNDEAIDLYHKLRQDFPFGLQAIDSILRGYRPRARAKQLLYLSDLHFGTDTARANIDYLREHLREKAETITRAVITGDLIDSPGGLDDPAFVEFKEFQRWLTREICADVLLVPGNHDQRWRGNRILAVGDDKTSLADLVLFKVVPDSNLRCVFLGLDSSRGGNLATGKVTESQMRDRRQEFDTQCSVSPDVRAYLRIAVLHHHPFPFVAGNETVVQRVLAMIGMDEERVLALEDREPFISWCQTNEIHIVLHGHKHKARFRPGGQPGEPTAIGCGTSLGAEGLPLSYNVLTIDPGSHSVAVSLFSDNGKKSGFEAQMTSIVQA